MRILISESEDGRLLSLVLSRGRCRLGIGVKGWDAQKQVGDQEEVGGNGRASGTCLVAVSMHLSH